MERLYIERLPEGLDAQDFIPHQKNPWSREQACFNASKTKFVAAFNIYEHTMMNEMGQIIWGSFRGNTALVEGFLQERWVFCWENPFAHWLGDACFAIKVSGGKNRYPVLAIHFEKGLQILGGSDHLKTRASHFSAESLSKTWFPSEAELFR